MSLIFSMIGANPIARGVFVNLFFAVPTFSNWGFYFIALTPLAREKLLITGYTDIVNSWTTKLDVTKFTAEIYTVKLVYFVHCIPFLG